MIERADVEAAAERIAGHAVRTPLLSCPWDDRGRLWLKPENLQPVGAFKIRGAVNALARLPERRRRAGVVTHSSGNHGQALAYAARLFDAPCTVVVPHGAPEVKVAAMRRFGAETVHVPPGRRSATAERLVAERGLTLVPPYDHADIIAGQGTVGLEIAADLPDAEVVLVPVGGGGLASGVATAVAGTRDASAGRRVQVWSVEPELAADAAESLAADRLITWSTDDTYRTGADGLRTCLSDLTFAHLRARLDGIVTVTEDAILRAVAVLAESGRIVAEPSGAVATAAYLSGAVPAGRTVAVVSGGNIDPRLLARCVAPDG